MNQLVPMLADRAAALVFAAGERTSYRLLEFFVSNIRYPNTLRTYARVSHTPATFPLIQAA
jgi:hypothetical protein